MRNAVTRYLRWVSATVLAGVVVAACSHTRDIAKRGVDAPPSPKGPESDNSRCHVCHINFEDEEFAVTHAKANVGCERCHGDSTPHCEDEDNVTPPDKMFAKADINRACAECHPKLADTNTDAHGPILAGTGPHKYCTECHGEHRLYHRTRRWDKRTRELIPSDAVRLLEASPGSK